VAIPIRIIANPDPTPRARAMKWVKRKRVYMGSPERVGFVGGEGYAGGLTRGKPVATRFVDATVRPNDPSVPFG
jgi:hypothetical protein